MATETINVGILVVSDSCSNGSATDTSGTNLRTLLLENQAYQQRGFDVLNYEIVPDDIDRIKSVLVDWSDNLRLNLILTSGGTGLGVRDFTPEATKQVIEKEIPSFTQTILIESLKITKFACLSRAVCGLRKKTLILNLPGSKKGSQESLEIILPVLKHSFDLINDSKSDIKSDHNEIQQHNHDHHYHNHHHSCEKRATTTTNKSEQSRVSEIEIYNRSRHSVYPMLPMEQVMSIVLGESNIQETEQLFYMDALNRVCSKDIQAKEPLPPYRASIKDGFAIKLTQEQKNYLTFDKKEKKIKSLFEFDVIGSANAGDSAFSIELKEGQCAKINTGGPVPLSADAVIQIEDTIAVVKNEKGEDLRIEIVGGGGGCGGSGASGNGEINLTIGQDIRPIGFDIKAGEVVVRKGTLIKAPQIGICATVGCLKVDVYKLPAVALISTGNELQSPDKETLESGQIRDSNKSLLKAALKSFGIEKIIDSGIANDDVNSVLSVFRKAMESADIVISTGGVSMGDRDLVRDVLIKDFGVQIHFAQMKMKPGKPTTFGTCLFNERKKLLFCLPGNPVSAIVTFNLLVVPCMKKLVGYENPHYTELLVQCEFDAELDPRPEYQRCRLVWPQASLTQSSFEYPKAYSTGNQHSSRLLSMNQANCLVLLPPRSKEKTRVSRGELYKALMIDNI